MIKTSDISKQFGDLIVLKNVSAQINKGECIAIIGPSGGGKSVFLRTIALLEKPDHGSVIINGIDITKDNVDINKVREKMGMVYQGFHLFSHLNVLDNITLAPRIVKKQPKMTTEKKAMELLAMVGLTDKARSYPHELSGGQQQRIAIARCLAMEPDILLFDEPTSALDPTMTCEVLSIIRKLTKMGFTMLIVTHEMKFARDVADRVFYIDEGGIYESGKPADIFDNPQKEKTKSFIRKLKVFNYEIKSKGYDIVTMNVQIELFCQKYNIEDKQIYYIQLILEELIVEIFKHCYTDSQPDLTTSVEYSDQDKEVSIGINYKTKSFNPFEQSGIAEDNLGMLLVTSLSKKSDHIFENGHNILTIKL